MRIQSHTTFRQSGTLLVEIEELYVRHQGGGSLFEMYVPHLRISCGDVCGIVGPSGCGKSTLLDVLALIQPPTDVRKFIVYHQGERIDLTKEILQLNSKKLSNLRRKMMGYILQTGGLFSFLNVGQNVNLAARIGGHSQSEGRALELLSRLGIGDQLKKLPAHISVGQRQRVAIARALIHNPDIVLADEPTAALDVSSGDQAFELLIQVAKANSSALLMASHDQAAFQRHGIQTLRHQFKYIDETRILSVFHCE